MPTRRRPSPTSTSSTWARTSRPSSCSRRPSTRGCCWRRRMVIDLAAAREILRRAVSLQALDPEDIRAVAAPEVSALDVIGRLVESGILEERTRDALARLVELRPLDRALGDDESL